MNAPDKIPFADQFALSREPFPASRKIYVPGSQASIHVPMREILLSNGEQVTVYDTSGPYSDPTAAIDVRTGLADVRGAWIESRGDTESYTRRHRPPREPGGKNAAQNNRTPK
ncbi:MAG: phosphomethylpyrimidine synthase ThiC, partial [Hydrogenophaga sp.]|nr:phosphomethylpyrimidine synthase ThiC [Hydrogenophaga sp.]